MNQQRTEFLIWLWTGAVILILYLPLICSALASFSKGRYFIFPIRAFSSQWWKQTLDSIEIRTLLINSLLIALFVTLISVIIAFCGALAFARYEWRGRKLFQKLLILPIFFPQPVLGLALLLSFNALGIETSWRTAIFAHLVWIVPVATLVMAIQVYGFDSSLEDAAYDLGCSRWQVLREVTLPLLWPGVWSGILFSFLLSWSNFPLSLYTSGADSTIPKWLYSKMVAGYTPMVPALGTMSTLGAAIILLASGLVFALIRRYQPNHSH
ncbi:MAG: ABC transporter permease [Synechococcaceae cyanobacterium SM2_3_1]|nr:ABC transporter permease [Synechococcaceae cyanobacterium SM2_3_1]